MLLVLTVYRYFFFTKEENDVFWAIRIKHKKKHFRRLTERAVPIVVAATVARAAFAIIEAMTEDEVVEIILTFMWAICFAQVFGYYIVYRVPDTLTSYSYLYKVGVENCAFAWKEAMTLVLVDVLVGEYTLAISFGGWLATVSVIAVLLVISNAIQLYLLRPDGITVLRTKLFEAEVYALGTSYTLNILVLGAGCGKAYIDTFHANTDDEQLGDVPLSYYSIFAFIYPLALTSLFAYLMASGVLDRASRLVEIAEEVKEATEAACYGMQRQSRDTSMSNKSNIGFKISGSVPRAHTQNGNGEDWLEEGLSGIEMQRAGSMASSLGPDSEFLRESEVAALIEPKCATLCDTLATACAPMDALLCSWDKGRFTRSSIGMIMVLFLSNYLGCAFFSWSVIFFGIPTKGLPDGHVFDVLLFAALMTYLALEWMTGQTTRLAMTEHARDLAVEQRRREHERKELEEVGLEGEEPEESAEVLLAKKPKKVTKMWLQSTKLTVMAFSLAAGLTWEVLVLGAVKLTFSDESGEHFKITRAAVFSALAIVLLVAGREVDKLVARQDEEEERKDEEQEAEFEEKVRLSMQHRRSSIQQRRKSLEQQRSSIAEDVKARTASVENATQGGAGAGAGADAGADAGTDADAGDKAVVVQNPILNKAAGNRNQKDRVASAQRSHVI